jgi:hypothetical protein
MIPLCTEVTLVKLDFWVTFGSRKFHEINHPVYLLQYRHFSDEQKVLCFLELLLHWKIQGSAMA